MMSKIRSKVGRLAALASIPIVAAGCETTAAGNAFGEFLIYQTAKSTIEGQFNPKGTNVTINNPGGGAVVGKPSGFDGVGAVAEGPYEIVNNWFTNKIPGLLVCNSWIDGFKTGKKNGIIEASELVGLEKNRFRAGEQLLFLHHLPNLEGESRIKITGPEGAVVLDETFVVELGMEAIRTTLDYGFSKPGNYNVICYLDNQQTFIHTFGIYE